ncbi:YihY/virulence factor BrkB family protein [Fulvivirga sp. M361]|uniref:YihY/virulence factor BrkB family protein n=1 Tax=Fulvivirga sp. M361 TaxID=2594266 RepID=UPI001179AEB8|nr:YihY/virulence factor BrkB family protein [Fulvivirga sp. M361]TRX60495.1 YihY/virulence factor BrkB family protein [Fulvivirga sp. M361]
MELSIKQVWQLIRKSFEAFFENNPFRHSAAIAYYTIFSMPGIAIIAVMVAGSFYEREAVRTELLNQVTLLMGSNSATQIETLMNKAFFSAESFVMKMVGVVTLLVSATTVFASLQQSVNTIWNIKPKPDKEILKFVTNRLLSLAMVASIGFLLLVSLMADTMIAILKEAMSGILAGSSYYLVWIINVGISLVLITLVFALIFKVLPDAEVRWKHVWTGAIVTTALFITGKYLIGYYLSTSNLGDAYGAAGSLVALLAWVYYSVLIVLYGAQFTFTYNQLKGRSIRPNDGAVAVKVQEIEKGHESVTKIE